MPNVETVWRLGQVRAKACPEPVEGGSVGSEELNRIEELAQMVAKVIGFRGKWRFDPAKPDGVPRKVLDVGRLQPSAGSRESHLRLALNSRTTTIGQKWAGHLGGGRNWAYHLWDVLMFQTWLEHWGGRTPILAPTREGYEGRSEVWLIGNDNSMAILQNPDDLRLLFGTAGDSNSCVRIIRGSGVDLHELTPIQEPTGTPLIVLAGRMLWDKGVQGFVTAPWLR